MLTVKNRLLIAAALASLLAFAQARADTLDAADQVRLEKASRIVRAKQADFALENSDFEEKGVSALASLGLDRFYRTGDHWRVLFAPRSKTVYRAAPLAGLAVDGYGRPIAYNFQVLRTGRYAASAGVVRRFAEIEITVADRLFRKRLEDLNAPAKIVLLVNDQYRGMRKTYHFAKPREDGTTEATESLDARRNISSTLDRFPLDVPNVSRAYGATPSEAPILPAELAAALGRAQPFEAASTLTFKYKNTLGRELLVAWSREGLWPAYTASEAGVAVLVSQERAGN